MCACARRAGGRPAARHRPAACRARQASGSAGLRFGLPRRVRYRRKPGSCAAYVLACRSPVNGTMFRPQALDWRAAARHCRAAMLTLRQIEVIRAVMVAGSVAGAARMLNVAQPGVSRTMKHLETVLGIKLFVRKGGRYVPSPEARTLFDLLQDVHKKLGDLQFSINQLERGKDAELSIASVPSIANVMVPRAIAGVHALHPDLKISFDVIKLEDAIDFLLLEKGELAVMSYRLEHPSLTFEPLAKGHLVCITAPGHPLSRHKTVSAADIV